MELNKRIKDAEFIISDKVIIRYKKGFGFWILKEIDNHWYVATTEFLMNPYGVGFKESYGFGYKDLKPFFFTSFDSTLKTVNKVDNFEYWEYNKATHEKFMDTILRKGRFNDIMDEIIDKYLTKFDEVYGK